MNRRVGDAPEKHGPRPASRRLVLAGSAGLLAGLPVVLAGCSEKPRAATPAAHPDVSILTGAIAAEEDLLALYAAATSKHGRLAKKTQSMIAHHREHLNALRRHYRPGTAPTTPAPRAQATASSEMSKALAALRAAERKAAAARTDDVRRASPALAQLLASIGACEAGHAVILGD